ncbi:hypothetical protein [Streptosporangium sp. NPDC000509]
MVEANGLDLGVPSPGPAVALGENLFVVGTVQRLLREARLVHRDGRDLL